MRVEITIEPPLPLRTRIVCLIFGYVLVPSGSAVINNSSRLLAAVGSNLSLAAWRWSLELKIVGWGAFRDRSSVSP
jgi:hypothetical protein